MHRLPPLALGNILTLKHTYPTLWVQVSVTVGDDNDVVPEFPLDTYTYHIPESSTPSTILSPVAEATDTDLGSNGYIEYYLYSPSHSSHPFEVEQSTGVVSLMGELDREDTSAYTLILEAVDRGTPSRTGMTELRFALSKSPAYLLCNAIWQDICD